jgi:hypothetical protein
VNTSSTLEIRHRLAGAVIAAGQQVLAAPIARWPRSPRQATAHAVLLAACSWVAAGVAILAGPGDRSIAGPLKGADFVHFYTLGHLAASDRVESIYDMQALHDAQVVLVPES